MNIFEITIQPKTDKGWPVAVKHTPSGNSPLYYKGTLNLNPEDNFAELGQYLGQPEKYGTELGKKLFTQEIRFAFDKALSCTQQNNTQERHILYVFLHLDTFNDDSLQTLRWERLCAPFAVGDDEWESLSVDRRTTFSIYVPTMTERLFPVIGKNDLRSLILVANPSNGSKYGLADFDVQKTVEGVQASLDNIPSDVLAKDIDGAVGLPTLEQLKHYLSLPDKYYTLLHLVCHGKFVRGETVIYLANDENETEVIKTSVLIKELKDLPRAPHFTFLCTCESAKSGTEMGGLAQSLAQKLGMPAVLGMTDPVTIYTAQQLASAFYRELREHGYPSLALSESLVELRRKRKDVIVPVLFSRLEGKPIYSQELDRKLTNADIKVGVERIQESDRQLLKQRAPILIPEFEQQEKNLGNLAIDFGVLSESDQNLRMDALKELNILCKQVFDISFNALALTGEITDYDSRCPFKGLKPFRAEDQDFFCGRESLIEKLREKQEKYNFLAVLGASGTGKSSVVLAGLIPLLEKHKKGIKVIEFTPDNRPLERLQEKLSGVAGESLVVVVDQFEEVFTLCEKTNRENFIAELLKLAKYQKVIITMRADFWGECAENEKLKELMLKNQELISPMNGEELRKAIEEQAEKVGLRFESGVVNLIEKDVESAPGEMPLLQYALEQLWQRRRGKWLLSEEYNQIGFKEAIARTADRFYSGLSETEKEQVKNIFLRLTRLDESMVIDEQSKYTRQRIYLHDLTSSENFQVIEKLVQRLAGEEARLVVTRTESIDSGGNGEQQITVEVAHEALITHWPKLQGWLNENHTNLQLRQSIREADLEWRKYEEESFLVHSGNRLAGAEVLLQEKGFLNESEIAYVNACISKQRDEEQRELRQARRARNVAIVFSVIVAGVGLFAVNQTKQAELNKADVLASSSLSLLSKGKELDAFIQIIEAGKILQKHKVTNSDIVGTLITNIEENRERNHLQSHKIWVNSVSFSPDGKTLASASWDNTIKLWNVETGEEIPTSMGHNQAVNSLSFSPDGKILASGSDDKTIRFWDVETRKEIQILPGHKKRVNSIIFSPDGKILASGSDDKTIKLWNVETGEEIPTSMGHSKAVNSVSFSPDSKILASGSNDKTIKLWNVEKRIRIITLSGHKKRINSVNFSPDGEMLASGSDDNTIRLWNVKTRKKIYTFKGHEKLVASVSFSHDGEMLASGSDDNTIRLWNVEKKIRIITLKGHNKRVNSVSFSPKDKTLASASWDNTIKLWNVEGGKNIRTLNGHMESIYGLAFSPNGKILASASWDNTIKLWDVKTGKEIPSSMRHKKAVNSVIFSPNGKILASASWDNTIKLWDMETRKEIPSSMRHKKAVDSVSFSPNGKFLASASWDNTIKLWNVKTGKNIHTLKGHNETINSLSFSPDGKILASGSWDKTIKLWDVKTGKKIHVFKGHNKVVNSVSFSPDGKILASGSDDKTIKLWNVKTGKKIYTLKGHDEAVNSVSFSSDGKILVSGSDDNTIELWNVETGKEIRTLTGHDEAVNSVSLSPDGNTVASGSDDNTIKLWSLKKLETDLDVLMKRSCDLVRNYLENNPNVEPEEKKLCDDVPSARD